MTYEHGRLNNHFVRVLCEVLLSWGILEVEILLVIQVLLEHPSTTPFNINIGYMTLWLVSGMHTLLIIIEALSIMLVMTRFS